MADGQQPTEWRERVVENAWFVFVMLLGGVTVGSGIALCVRGVLESIACVPKS